jgi:hypothetical protein
MRIPGFTAELALQDRSTIALRWLGPARAALAGITPQLFTPPRAGLCSWPCFVNAQGQCICPF